MKIHLNFLALLTALLLVPGADATPGKKPNVIFILADDLGWSDTTLHGTTRFYQTPNVGRLAKRGITFTRAYSASPLCSPTRSAILTGLSPARTGITSPNGHDPKVILQATPGKMGAPDQKTIPPGVVTRLLTTYPTLSRSLKDAGYATGHFGKWHLGTEPYSPLQHGFDVDLPRWPGPGPAGSFLAPWKFKNFDPDPGVPDQHIEDRMARQAAVFMEKHKDGPFYLNYWMFSVHAPFNAKKALIEKHRARMDPNDPQRCPTYAAMVESMDDAIGTLLDTLDRLKIADNTIIIFTSDNGGNMYNEVDGTTPTNNTPLRGGKATVFEGGTRVPCVVVWPGITTAGTRSDAIIQSEDYYPTLLEGLELKPAEGQRFDGASILPALKGEPLAGKAVFQYFPHSPGVPDWLPPSVSVHRGDWKLIRIFHGGENGAHRHLLFNLREDPGEKHNLTGSNLDLVSELDGLIQSFLTKTKAVVPVPNPAFDPAKYRPELEGIQTNRSKPKPKAAANDAPVKPNILWIIMDDVGAELPCYGEKTIQTPNIDRLVREGTKFDRAFLTTSVCSPSRSAMITGMYQTSIGAHHHRSGRGTEKIHLPPGVEPVPALFQRAGYFTSNGDYPAKGKRLGKTDYNFEWDHKIYDGSEWSGRKPGQPFFAQIQLWGGKNRNDNGRWYREVAPKALGTLTKPEDAALPPYYPRDPRLLEDWAQYLDCIRFSDRQLGEILQRLETEGILDQTFIILMGDNGISDARGKQFLYDRGIRTPFIVRGPGIARGAVRSDLIEHIDMAATSLALAGLPVPARMQGRDIFAKDYKPCDAVFAARDRCDETVDRIRCVRTGQFKYIRNFHPQRPMLQPNDYKDTKPTLKRLRELQMQGKLSPLQEELLFSPSRPAEELYDVHADPYETRNLAGDPRHLTTLETLRTRLDRWLVETRDPGPESEKAYDANLAYELNTPAGKARKDALIKNSVLMKQWAKEGK